MRKQPFQLSSALGTHWHLSKKATHFHTRLGQQTPERPGIDSAQMVYRRLLMRTPDEHVLQFETLALLALQKDGTIDQEKAKVLVKLFRPDREGKKLDLYPHAWNHGVSLTIFSVFNRKPYHA